MHRDKSSVKNTTETIWHKYNARLTGFIRSKVSEDFVDDLLQEVFIKIHANIDSLKTESKLESWLYQITRNTIADYYRTHRITEELPKWIELPQTKEEELIRQELASCLTPMINMLPDKYRRAVQISEVENKTQQEVADQEGLSLSGAKSRVQRGRALLKTMLHDCCEIEINKKNHITDYQVNKTDCDCC